MESDTQVRDVLAEGLSDHGFDVVSASSPSTALQIATRRRFDIALIDIAFVDKVDLAFRLRETQVASYR